MANEVQGWTKSLPGASGYYNEGASDNGAVYVPAPSPPVDTKPKTPPPDYAKSSGDSPYYNERSGRPLARSAAMFAPDAADSLKMK